MAYFEASAILTKIEEKKGSIKSLCLTSKFKNKKQLYALVCESLKYSAVVKAIIENTRLLQKEKSLKNKQYLAHVLVYDFLFGRGIHVAGKLKDAITRNKAALKAELARQKIKVKAVTNYDLIKDTQPHVALPRYARVNTLTSSVESVSQHFSQRGYTQQQYDDGITYNQFIEAISKLKPKQFMQDMNIPELLVFTAGTDLHDHPLYKSGDIILQDKASCLPAYLLAPPPGGHVIDCCAAPGNKTSHAAARMNNKGKIFAFDKDAYRLCTMNTLTLKASVACAELKHQDFLTVDPQDRKYADVEYAIVDPSCSGSGIVSRLNHITDNEDSASDERLQNLAKFQVAVLMHTLAFPKMRRVVYSTCSVHEVENEGVVKAVMKEVKDRFQLKPILLSCPSRGLPVFPGSQNCLRLGPETDRTNGFFVVCFERKGATNADVTSGGGNVNFSLESNISNGANDTFVKKKKKKKQKKLCAAEFEVTDHGKNANREAETNISADSDAKCVKKKLKKNPKKMELGHTEVTSTGENVNEYVTMNKQADEKSGKQKEEKKKVEHQNIGMTFDGVKKKEGQKTKKVHLDSRTETKTAQNNKHEESKKMLKRKLSEISVSEQVKNVVKRSKTSKRKKTKSRPITM